MSIALADLPTWPAALMFDEAVAYTRIAETELRRHAREGRVRFLPRGPHGALIAQRSELDQLLESIWASQSGQPLEDMDFGEG